MRARVRRTRIEPRRWAWLPKRRVREELSRSFVGDGSAWYTDGWSSRLYIPDLQVLCVGLRWFQYTGEVVSRLSMVTETRVNLAKTAAVPRPRS